MGVGIKAEKTDAAGGLKLKCIVSRFLVYN